MPRTSLNLRGKTGLFQEFDPKMKKQQRSSEVFPVRDVDHWTLLNVRNSDFGNLPLFDEKNQSPCGLFRFRSFQILSFFHLP